MRIIKPSVELVAFTPNAELLLEQCARVCYKSEGKSDGTLTGAEAFLKRTIKRGHESVIEHASATVRVVCDRSVSHELVRHRLASYSQESTRYCNYQQDKFGKSITVIEPCYLEKGTAAYRMWKHACETAEVAYFDLLGEGCTPQEARAVLPNSLKTEVMMTANVREWRHFLKLRTSEAAHPQMREVALQILELLDREWPSLFDDIVWRECTMEVTG